MKTTLVILSSLFFLPANAQSISPDPTFGNSGMAITPNMAEITRFTSAPDGSIFSCSYQMQGNGTGIYHLAVSKHLSNGTPDPNFGINGTTTTSIDYSEYPLDIRLQPDGKVLVSGSSYLGPTPGGPGDYRAFTVRFTASGDPDQTFGTNGVFKLDFNNSHTASVIPLSNGDVILAGNGYNVATVTKVDASGNPVTTFGSNGTRFLSDYNFAFLLWNAILLSDSSILCMGYDLTDSENPRIAYCKLDQDGNYSPSFGQNGKVVMDISPSQGGMIEASEYLSRGAETADQKIILAGTAGSNFLLRILPDGTPDAAFGTNGVLLHALPFSDFTLQPDGKILLTGSKLLGAYNYGYSVSRLDQQGNSDLSFNGTGTFDLDISAENDLVQCIGLSGTKILLGGSSKTTPEASATLVRLDSTQQHLEVLEKSQQELLLYPNPFTDRLFLSISPGQVSEINLTDACGRTVYRTSSPVNKLLDLEKLPAGVYNLVLRQKNGEISHTKVMKQ